MHNTDKGETVSRTPGASSATPTDSPSQTSTPEKKRLFNEAEIRDFSARWDQVQGAFVDDPRHALELADALTVTILRSIADQLSRERAKLEKQWNNSKTLSTEELRQNFQRYHAFFDRLLVL
jgi:hypothetical protein